MFVRLKPKCHSQFLYTSNQFFLKSSLNIVSAITFFFFRILTRSFQLFVIFGLVLALLILVHTTSSKNTVTICETVKILHCNTVFGKLFIYKTVGAQFKAQLFLIEYLCISTEFISIKLYKRWAKFTFSDMPIH